ncbi:peptide chain release factor N(5)-glutamine methyltransferase [uncultured Dietzia sp.]|uniref:peptide chain release factor N(5)-glutamine methyltransferase n=1 Tax=uncultured Dietzia sp. TaxID=395519 RepID=UPI0026399F97|nr:peptide chain release factor N(5)-glutamine methyltransferase [uncultured Dietzia sp.]HMT50455.1 peptide chain release factor N(5)-glutamine methyltransferase [Dietzia sp.]
MDAQPAPAAVTGVVRSAARALRSAGVDSALAEAQLICAHVLGVDRSALPLADGLDPAEVAEVGRIVAARARDRTPLQYLLGRATSGRLDLAVGPGVFIPRPETELLVENALAALPAPGEGPGPIVVDLCAGSGTLALEIAHARPDAYVHAVELHGPALEWLRRNAGERAAAGDTPVEVHAADATDPALLPDLRGRVAAVVANPPYIPQTDDLPADVLGHEPATALFGGADGLVVITPLVHVAAGLLAPGGHLAVEHDDATGAAVAAVVCAQGGFGNVDQHTDLAGRPRFVTATRRAETDDDEVDQTVRKGITR